MTSILADGDRDRRDVRRAMWAWCFAAPRSVWAAVVCGVVWTMSAALFPSVIGTAIDALVAGGADDGAVAATTAAILVIGVARSLSLLIRGRSMTGASLATGRMLRERLHTAVLRLDPAQLGHAGEANLVNMVADDIPQIEFSVVAAIVLANNVLWIGLITIGMVLIDPPLAATVLVCLTTVTALSALLVHRLGPATIAQREAQVRYGAATADVLEGFETLKGYRSEAAAQSRLLAESSLVRAASLRAGMVRARFIPPIEFVASILLVVVAAVLGAEVLRGGLSLGDLVTFVGYASMLVWPARFTGTLITAIQRGAVATDRILRVLDLHGERVPTSSEDVAPHWSATSPAIEIRGLSVGFSDGTTLFEGLDLVVERGECVAIMGGRGCGKSTLAAILTGDLRIYSGSVRVGGASTADLPYAAIASAVALVPQNPSFFRGTVLENLTLDGLPADRGRVQDATTWAAFEGGDNPLTLDTVVSERGASLSGGMKERVALARSLVHDHPVVVLDDIGSALDPVTARAVADNVRAWSSDRAVVLLTNQRAMARVADRVVTLSDPRRRRGGRS